MTKLQRLREWFETSLENQIFPLIDYKDFGGIEFIGNGGFGNVYSTTCTSLGCKVAVKKILKTYHEDYTAFEGFVKEVFLSCIVLIIKHVCNKKKPEL